MKIEKRRKLTSKKGRQYAVLFLFHKLTKKVKQTVPIEFQ